MSLSLIGNSKPKLDTAKSNSRRRHLTGTIKKYLALWVVTIVFGALVAFLIGSVDFFLAEEIRRGSNLRYAYTCWDSVIFEECFRNRSEYFVAYPAYSLLFTVPGFVLYSIVVGSFRTVFKKSLNEKS